MRPTLRRTLEQAKHCVEEALSVVMNDEAPKSAIEDVEQARELLGDVLDRLAKSKSVVFEESRL